MLPRTVSETEYVLVVDNTPEIEGQERVRGAITEILRPGLDNQRPEKIVLEQVGRNIGLSRAYNTAIRKAKELRAGFLLLLDQDSKLVPGTVRTLLERYDEACRLGRVGSISCSNVESVRVNVGFERAISRLRERRYTRLYETHRLVRSGHVREILTFTNSGTLIPMNRFDDSGQFDESLFLDAIDYDYSLQLRAQGFRLFVADDAFVLHSQGTALQRKMLGRSVQLRTYPPQRSYHITHDTWSFARRWFRRYPGIVAGIMMSQVQGTMGALMLLPERAIRMRFVLRALRELHKGSTESGP